MKGWDWLLKLFILGIFCLLWAGTSQAGPRVSENTEACLGCHTSATPGIVSDWRRSVHSRVSPGEGLKKAPKTRKISASNIPDKLVETVVGCAECHTLNPGKHKDSFDHNGFKVHVVVTPENCSICHPTEAKQYAKNIMSHAHGNLKNNPLYRQLADSINGVQSFHKGRTILKPPDPETQYDSCFFCHGTEVKVRGFKARDTDMGRMEFPVLSGWPNQGVGRINPDGSKGSCAACHVSLVVNEAGNVVAERTHQMNDRLPWRIFGLIYAHPRPKSPDTTIIKNKAGLPLPTELTGEPVSQYLIDAKEQEKRRAAMQNICLSCHSDGWVQGQFARLENTIKTTNEMTRAATEILLTAWKIGAAKGPAQNDSPFNEAIEKKWVEQWLFYANSTRFASAMAGADYGVFANGRWYMSKNLQEMVEWLKAKTPKRPALKSKETGKP